MRRLITLLTLALTLLIVASCNDDKEEPMPAQYRSTIIYYITYVGDLYEKGVGGFGLYLYERDLLTNIDKSYLSISLNSDVAPDIDNITLTEGTYKVSKTGARMTIPPGEIRNYYCIGSVYRYFGMGNDPNERLDSIIIGGSIKVEKSGNIYTITTKLKTHRGEWLFFKYEGEIEFMNFSNATNI